MIEMKILIKGAGDLATGIASRLYHAGHQIVMTEIEVPLTVRRMVALSRAVYEGRAKVEDMVGVLVSDFAGIQKAHATGEIPILIDPAAEIRFEYHPDVIIDAILAKKNLGTKMTDAPFVVGIGPGFCAGEDCHCVIETQRGHTLGVAIYEGEAIPNTGIPGEVGGFSTERLIRATANGMMEPIASIGDVVEKGQVVARTGGKEVYAQMSGIVRGMLQPDVCVHQGLKIGDIDARCELFHCFTISDKARSIGGGVLEAVSRFERMQEHYAVVILAAGRSVRFDGNKLFAEVDGKKLYQHTLERMHRFQGMACYVVTGYEEIVEEAKALGMQAIYHTTPEKGIAYSMQLGLQVCRMNHPQLQGVMFMVCDQPYLKPVTIQKMMNLASTHPNQIICVQHEGESGNPVLWTKPYFEELSKLEGDKGGKQLISKYSHQVLYVEAMGQEVKDIDFRNDIP
jgi:xanthine dehydrogenase accessory factor